MTRLLDVTHRGVQVLQVGCQGPLVHCRRGRVSRAGLGRAGFVPTAQGAAWPCVRRSVCLSVCTALHQYPAAQAGETTRVPCWDQQVTRSSWCSLLEKPGVPKGAWNVPRTGAHRTHGDGHPGSWEGTGGTQDSRTTTQCPQSLGSWEPPVKEGLSESWARYKFQLGKLQVQTFLKWKFTAPGRNLLLYLCNVALIPKGIAQEQQGMVCKGKATRAL